MAVKVKTQDPWAGVENAEALKARVAIVQRGMEDDPLPFQDACSYIRGAIQVLARQDKTMGCARYLKALVTEAQNRARI